MPTDEDEEWISNLRHLRINPDVQKKPRVWERSAREVIEERAIKFDHSLSKDEYEKLFTRKGWADALERFGVMRERQASDESEEVCPLRKRVVEDDGGICRFVWHWMMNDPEDEGDGQQDAFAVAPGKNKFCLRGTCGACGHVAERNSVNVAALCQVTTQMLNTRSKIHDLTNILSRFERDREELSHRVLCDYRMDWAAVIKLPQSDDLVGLILLRRALRKKLSSLRYRGMVRQLARLPEEIFDEIIRHLNNGFQCCYIFCGSYSEDDDMQRIMCVIAGRPYVEPTKCQCNGSVLRVRPASQVAYNIRRHTRVEPTPAPAS